MSEKQTSYEFALVIDCTLGDEAVATMVEKFRALVAANGVITTVDEWGKRRLAYPINYKTEGYYVFYSFTTFDQAVPAELSRIAKITEGILRYMAIAKEIAPAKEVVVAKEPETVKESGAEDVK